MQLKRVNYSSAIYFGAFVFALQALMSLILAIVDKINPNILATLYGQQYAFPGFLNSVILVPLSAAVSTYLTVLIAIWIYNWVARKYPISWETKK